MGFADNVARLDGHVQQRLGQEPVIYTPQGGPPVLVTGTFDDAFKLVTGMGSEAGVETSLPTVFLQLADLPVDPDGDTPILTIRGVAYRVAERLPAGLGSIVLALRKAG